MRKNNCEVVRRELDEVMLDEAFSTSAVEHLKQCSACREFHEKQTRLRRMVGGLGTVEAPPDFDFRLRARLANDPGNGTFHYWPLVQRGLAATALLIVFGFGVVVVKNILNQPKENVVVQTPPPVPQQSPKQVETAESNTPAATKEFTAHVPPSGPVKIRSERFDQTGPRTKRQLATVDSSKEGVGVISASQALATDAGTVFPIDATLQPLRLSLDDGTGNAKTISVPTIRFGSQRMLPNRYRSAEKGIW